MNVLILGESCFNNTIGQYLSDCGYHPVQVGNVDDVRSVKGEIGSFTVNLKDQALEAGFVVLTEQPESCPENIGGGAIGSLFDDNKVERLSKKDRLSPIVLLLDYYWESPMASTIKALTDAKLLSEKKRKVYFLSKFIRTGGRDVEALYKAARNAGVTFIKYEKLDICYDDDSMAFTIQVSDGVMDVEIVTKDMYSDGREDTGGRFSNAVKKLRLFPDEEGYVTEDRYYLTPVETSRRGVYHITKDVGYERLMEGLGYILSQVKTAKLPSAQTENTAVVDGEKCVLCYTCYRACPHAAMEPDQVARVMKNLDQACEGCGICASVCPGNAITLKGEIDKNTVLPKSGKALVLCCENSAQIALQKALPQMGELGSLIDVEPVPCGGRIGLEQISNALSEYGKVMVAVCMDDACRHVDGNKRACRQTGRIVEMLNDAGLFAGRIEYIQVSHAMPKVLRDALTGFIKGGNL